MLELKDYKRKKEYLVCVDSDGCAMDTMDVKHFNCFGPCMIDEWGLNEWKEDILYRWNEVNLYTLTRGINRFKGLALALKEVDEKYKKIDGADELFDWTEHADELSNEALEREIAKSGRHEIFKKALNWSKAVNIKIKALPKEEVKPFLKVKEALEFAHKNADIAVVSSANLGAVLEEWERFHLLEHTDIVLSQNVGSKAFCIAELLKKGYKKENVLMCGDALGDMQSAEKNGVFYYPILVKKEAESWQEFIDEGFNRLINNTYKDNYAQQKKTEFLNNLGGKQNG